jgi:predicted AAA+ superfamily ATPase
MDRLQEQLKAMKPLFLQVFDSSIALTDDEYKQLTNLLKGKIAESNNNLDFQNDCRTLLARITKRTMNETGNVESRI